MFEPIRVLHIGDLHLGVELYGRPDPEKGYGTRTADFLNALDQALANVSRADLVVFPGDIYKSCDPNPTVQREFARRIRKTARQAPVVIIPGNHDLPNMWGRASSVDIFHVLEIENVHILRQPKVERIATRRGDVLIAPLPFMPRSTLIAQEEARGKTIEEVQQLQLDRLTGYLTELAGQVEEARKELGEDTPAILMAHYTIQGAVFGGYGKGGSLTPEIQLPLPLVKNGPWDYVALAHIHKHQELGAGSHPPVVYPGSIERVDFGEEHEAKVVVLADVTRGSTEWRPCSLSPVPFKTLRLTAEEADPLASIKSQLEKWKEAIDGAVVRVYYTLPGGHPNLPERELRPYLEGARCVAGIRRETPETDATRIRSSEMSTQLTPVQALEVYLKTQPHLQSKREELLKRGQTLIAEVAPDTVESL